MDVQHTILTKITKIESYLYDDEDTNSPGMVQKQREIEKRLAKLEDESMVRKSIFATLGIIGGAVGMFIVEVVKYFLTKHN